MSAAFVPKNRREYIDFIAQKIRPTLTALDLERAAAAKKVVLAGAVIVPITLVIGLPAMLLHPILGIFIGAFGAVGLAIARHNATNRYHQRFKDRLIGPLVKFYDESLRFTPEAGISRHEFDGSRLFRGRIDQYSSEDLVDGRLGATAIRFSEIKAKREEGSGKNKRMVTVFSGVFFAADFNKHFRGTTFVLPDTAQRMLGSFGQSLQSLDTSYGQIVKLEDAEFERAFVVYASDQVEARYILSSALMQRIVEFRRHCNRKVRLGFVGAHVYLAVETGKNLFEPPLFSALTTDVMQEYWTDIQLFGGIVESLSLNTRIWSKE